MIKFPNKRMKVLFIIAAAVVAAYGILFLIRSNQPALPLKKDAHIVLIGNNLGSRMMNYGHFETELQMRYPDSNLFIRNMCDGGNTPGFRPHASRQTPWAFPGAEKFQTTLAHPSDSQGFFETEDQWLTRLKADIIIAFFGYNESFAGAAGLENYKAELDAFIKHTLKQQYNGTSTPKLALVSPIAFEDLSDQFDLPDGKKENKNLALYADAMKVVAAENGVHFVDVYTPTKRWFKWTRKPITIDGSQLSNDGYARFAPLLADLIFGKEGIKHEEHRDLVHAAVIEKNWMWHNDIKIPNGVHVNGRRYDPFGPDNYPAEIVKIREMTAIRDRAIWAATHGEQMNVAIEDKKTTPAPEVQTNYNPDQNGSLAYLYGDDALAKLKVAPGFKIELFASEKEFPDLANPCQITFDNKGRLWVATMPSYPHYKPGDSKPNDKLIILEDTDHDGKADKQTVFADGLHLPVGFEITADGVYLSQGTNFMLLKDTDGDDRADVREIILSGFDDHDTHHNIHAFTVDPSGALIMGEGVFLHSNIETSYGPVRATNGGFYRYSPQRRHLERMAQPYVPNPWGIAFDDWGQNFYAETSGPDVHWMLPVTIKPKYGVVTPKSRNLIQDEHRVRPTSGLEFVSSRHFPDEWQGDFLINNTIGFLGTKQHSIVDEGTGYKSMHRQDLLQGEDKNFRPVDMEFAPDGSLYIADWHNMLIGHMQHNARDPLRDHVHGRIYRITYPARPLIKPAQIADAGIPVLLENLKLPEYRTRYRTRAELRGRKADEVLPLLKTWVARLDKNDPKYAHHLTEALWVSWGLNQVDQQLLRQLLQAPDYHARAAAVRVLRYTGHQVKDQDKLLMQAAQDTSGRVRLEAMTAASWLPKEKGLPILMSVAKAGLDDWIEPAYTMAFANLKGEEDNAEKKDKVTTSLRGAERDLYVKGKVIFAKEGYCVTCHQTDGKGLPLAGFPPLNGTKWVTGSQERLINVVLKGLHGPMEVKGEKFPGQVPMTPFEGMLNDEEVAAVLTYVRNSFGNKASAVTPEKVKTVRAASIDKKGFYAPEELLKKYPLER
ncbi:dehydrogenase [Sphingobacterium sp. ML3W]|uniref:PVC-type heme-binding CxxCH protein n=1 Tax=Sphingobacterium sp. ML3W TaxID=1538644 RepID=UPI0004F68772|nr:PVC-type heme-binding CxxCH protein [Sphingobacterium sp. ML3W]AIM37262.1 dehydrogenase [Sphingobacterium sp. ML3W]